MSVQFRFRDAIRRYVPWWLADRPAKNAGFRFLWAMVAPLDAAAEVLLEGLQAAWPGLGTPTALPLIGSTRGILRGQKWRGRRYVLSTLMHSSASTTSSVRTKAVGALKNADENFPGFAAYGKRETGGGGGICGVTRRRHPPRTVFAIEPPRVLEAT